MKEFPALFNGPMVRAILPGIKTMTRRPFALPDDWHVHGPLGTITSKHPKKGKFGQFIRHNQPIDGDKWMLDIVVAPYGKVGDQIWVRENFQPIFADGWDEGRNEETRDPVNYETGDGYNVSYTATEGIVEFYDSETDELSTRIWPSIHMPRWASRIQLEVTGVRVERLQDITDEDALAEGIIQYQVGSLHVFGVEDTKIEKLSPRAAFFALWDELYGRGVSDTNPYVWAYSFKVIKP
jgi:hypothetical protein